MLKYIHTDIEERYYIMHYIASVLTFVRNAFGNDAKAITPEKVKEVREAIKDKDGFYSPEELLKEHPMK